MWAKSALYLVPPEYIRQPERSSFAVMKKANARPWSEPNPDCRRAKAMWLLALTTITDTAR